MRLEVEMNTDIEGIYTPENRRKVPNGGRIGL
jgi:hypothetical protein